MSISLTILGSGSAGNCSYVETESTRILVDAGFSGRQIRQKLAALSRAPETLNGILITHEHSDHITGLTGLAAKLNIPIYCNRLTRDAIEFTLKSNFDFRIFTTGTSFEIGDLSIDAFSIPHDAQDPVGFLVRHSTANLGFLTDLGHATKLVMERVRPANVLLLESNHDVKMLQEDTKRPWSTKQRILGRHGHLSNEAAADLAQEILSDSLKHLYLGHLSRDCNRPELALKVMSQRLTSLGAAHIQISHAAQDTPCPTLHVSV